MRSARCNSDRRSTTLARACCQSAALSVRPLPRQLPRAPLARAPCCCWIAFCANNPAFAASQHNRVPGGDIPGQSAHAVGFSSVRAQTSVHRMRSDSAGCGDASRRMTSGSEWNSEIAQHNRPRLLRGLRGCSAYPAAPRSVAIQRRSSAAGPRAARDHAVTSPRTCIVGTPTRVR